jgi:hypothetical protein
MTNDKAATLLKSVRAVLVDKQAQSLAMRDSALVDVTAAQEVVRAAQARVYKAEVESAAIARKTRLVDHVIDGKCMGTNQTRISSSRCDKPAKSDCPSCGGPHCGMHARKLKYGYGHNCGEWMRFGDDLLSQVQGRHETMEVAQEVSDWLKATVSPSVRQ